MTPTLTKPEIRVLPDVSSLVYDEKKHFYSRGGKPYTGVTSVLDGTSSKQNLIGWAANVAVDHIKDSAEVELDEKGTPTGVLFIEERDLVEARKAHTKKKDKAAKNGTDIHGIVEKYIRDCIECNEGEPLFEGGLGHLPISPFISWAQTEVKYFLAAEQRLYDEENAVAGTADFFYVSVNDELTTGDLKTFAKMWSPDAFVQTGVYARMWRLLTGNQPVKSVIVRMCDPEDPRLKKYNMPPFAVYPRYAVEEDEAMFLQRLGVYRYNQNFVSPTN